MIQNIIDIFGDVLDAVTLYMFCQILLGKKSMYLGKYITMIIITSVHIVWGLVSDAFPNQYLFLIVGIIHTFGIMFLYKTKLYFKLFMTIGFYAMSVASEIVTSGIISGLANAGNETGYYYGIICSKLLMLLLVIVIALIVKRNIYIRDKKYMIGMLICPIFSISIFILFTFVPGFGNQESSMINGLIGLIIIAMNISVYYMLDSIQEISELREKEIFMKNNLEVQTQNVQNIRDKFTQIRRVIHDSEKHLKSIRKYVVQNQNEEAVTYIDNTLSVSNAAYRYINTGNIVVDALVSDLINKCNESEIKCKTDIRISNDMPANNYDLTVILGNLLDNAFNAVVSNDTRDRFIDIRIVSESDNCLIVIKNPITERQKSAMVKSFGIENIEESVEKNGGIYHTEIKNGIYESDVFLPFTNEK